MNQELKQNRIYYFFGAYLFLILGYSFNKGIFQHPAQLGFIVLAFLLLILPLFGKNIIKPSVAVGVETIVLLTALVSFILFYFFDGGIHFTRQAGFFNTNILKFLSLIVFSFYLLQFDLAGKNLFSAFIDHLSKHKFKYLIGLALIARLVTILYSPRPAIDVFWTLDSGADQFLQGKNPYALEWTFHNYLGEETINHKTIAYLPLTLVTTTFFKALFGDIRTVFVFSSFVIALAIYLMTKKFGYSSKMAELLTLTFLYSPLSLFVLEQTWVDVFALMFMFLFCLSLVYEYKKIPMFLFAAMLLVKQPMIGFAFFAPKLKYFNLKKIVLTIVIFAAAILPFFVWSPSDFIDDAVFDHLRRFDDPAWSLSISNLISSYLNLTVPTWFILGFLFSLYLGLMLKTSKSLVDFVYSGVLFLLGIFMFKRGFANYYHLISSGLLLVIVLELGKIKKYS